MPIEDMSQEFLNAEREPVDFDALIDKAVRGGESKDKQKAEH